MRSRRFDDRAPSVLLATPSGWIVDGGRPRWADVHALRPGLDGKSARPLDDGLVLLLEDGADEAVLVSASRTCRIPRGGEDDLLWQAAARVRQERMRMEKRQRLPDQLIAYFEELNAADAEEDVFRAL